MGFYCRGALASVLLTVTHCAASAAPDYIEAESAELASAYGEKVAERAFSDELSRVAGTSRNLSCVTSIFTRSIPAM
jgi:hypothetical protein